MDVWENSIESSGKLKSKPHPFGVYVKNKLFKAVSG